MDSIERSQHRGPSRLSVQRTNNSIMIAIVAAIVVIVGGAIAAWALNGGASAGSVIDSGKYQAIFLTNGQNYFGKLQSVNGDYFKLTDIYYLQAPATSADGSTKTDDSQKLTKLGNEIHGPEDEMIISKEQVLFFENLKPDSKVSKLISQDK